MRKTLRWVAVLSLCAGLYIMGIGVYAQSKAKPAAPAGPDPEIATLVQRMFEATQAATMRAIELERENDELIREILRLKAKLGCA